MPCHRPPLPACQSQHGPSELRYGITLLRNVSHCWRIPHLQESLPVSAPQSVPVATEEPHSPLLSALQRVGLSAVAGRTNHLWVGWRGVCYTTRVLLTIVSSVGGKSVCGVGMCVFGEGGQGQGQAVGLYLELNAKQFYVLCGYQCCNGKLNMWTRIITGIIKHPKTK